MKNSMFDSIENADNQTQAMDLWNIYKLSISAEGLLYYAGFAKYEGICVEAWEAWKALNIRINANVLGYVLHIAQASIAVSVKL
jgi:hypothetical protein